MTKSNIYHNTNNPKRFVATLLENAIGALNSPMSPDDIADSAITMMCTPSDHALIEYEKVIGPLPGEVYAQLMKAQADNIELFGLQPKLIVSVGLGIAHKGCRRNDREDLCNVYSVTLQLV